MTRREWLATAASAAALSCARSGPPASTPTADAAFELEEITLAEIAQTLAAGEHTAESLAQAYLERIESHDQGGPAVNSVIEVNPDALAEARRLDQERAGGRVRGPLHGVPILIKDNIDSGDRMQTTAGSLALSGSVAQADAGVTAALREAGVVLLGKTNLSEWANFRSRDSTSGWSGRGGLTRNPYALDRNACGSSSGSGAAASANFCAAAVGTETNGSVICPSSINGLVGIKPTVGLVAQAGIIPISASQDTAGPMARTVADAAALLTGMVDPAVRQAREIPADYTEFLDPRGLDGVRLGAVRPLSGRRQDVDRIFEESLQALRDAGAEIVDVEEFPDGDDYGEESFALMLYEFKDGLNRYLAGLGPDVAVKTLADVIEFNSTHAEQELRWFGQDILELAEEMGPLSEPAYSRAKAKTKRVASEGIDGAMRRRDVQALVSPSTGPAWVTDLIHGDHSSLGSSSAAARAGYPHITVPAGFIEGLPVGLSFYASAWEEPKLIKLTSAFERTRSARRPPRFRPSVAPALEAAPSGPQADPA